MKKREAGQEVSNMVEIRKVRSNMSSWDQYCAEIEIGSAAIIDTLAATSPLSIPQIKTEVSQKTDLSKAAITRSLVYLFAEGTLELDKRYSRFHFHISR